MELIFCMLPKDGSPYGWIASYLWMNSSIYLTLFSCTDHMGARSWMSSIKCRIGQVTQELWALNGRICYIALVAK